MVASGVGGVEDDPPCCIIDTKLLTQLPDTAEAGTSPDVYVFGKLHPFTHAPKS